MKSYIPSRVVFSFVVLIFFIGKIRAQQEVFLHPTVNIYGVQHQLVSTSDIKCYIDSTQALDLKKIQQTSFTITPDSIQKVLNNGPHPWTYWMKFGLKNTSDSTLHLYIYAGELNFINLYFVPPEGAVQFIKGGDLRAPDQDSSYVEQMTNTLSIYIPPHATGEVYVQVQQKTLEFYFQGFEIYNRDALYQSFYKDYEQSRYAIFFQILFLGFLLSQILYVLFQGVIIRRKEYLYYFLYLLVVVIYYLSKYEPTYGIRVLFTRFPMLQVYLGKTMLILPYIMYFKFIQAFLELPKNFPKINKWISWVGYFLVVYTGFDFIFIATTFDQRTQSEIFTFVFLVVFLLTAFFVIHLFRKRQTLIYYVVTGSLFAAIGNILGLVLTYLADNRHIYIGFENKVVYSQIGVVLETICFTAGLGYKSHAAEKEKIRSQNRLIEQLRANEELQLKMQNIRNEIARDLHDEIGSTLSSISILSELALKEKTTGPTLDMINSIKENSVSLMEKMDDIIWSINPRNDSMEKLLIRVRQFATTLFEARNIDYIFSIQDEVKQAKLPIEFRQHIYLILKESVNNLVKYAQASKASVEIGHKENVLEITVKDNGKGFILSDDYEGNGIISMKNRADMMGAELSIDTHSGKGTIITLKVKIK